jgi:CubicO group peptidase (beta-lactamase class C family)
MQGFVDDGTISGAVTLVGRRGKIIHLQAVGLADIEREKPMRRNSMFSIASMTKPIVATGVMILQDEGKLNVNDKLSKYIPAFAQVKLSNGDAVERELTIRDAITHTSGLAGNQIFSGTLADAVDDLTQRPLAFQPGSKWQYSPGLNVAGRIIEIVAEQPLQDFLKQRIFDPLGMRNTTFFPDQRQLKRIATLYGLGDDKKSLVAVENRIVDPDEVKAPNPSGGLMSTARDMYRFYQMVLNHGEFRQLRILSAVAVSEMTSPQTGDLTTGFTPGNCWGLGWCILREPQGVTGMLSPGTYGHGGAFGTQGWVDPETKTVYVLMIQRTEMGNSDASDVRMKFQEIASKAAQ